MADSVGYNRHATPRKQYALNSVAGHLLGTCLSVARRRRVPCFVSDMTAGPGRDPTGRDGSPLIIAKHLQALQSRLDVTATLICVERSKAFLSELRSVLGERFPDLSIEYFTDQEIALARVPTAAVGMTYWDPNGYSKPGHGLDIDLLANFSRSHQYMDVLFTRECGAAWRMQHAKHCPGTLTIQDYLALTGKTCNYIMQYADWHWWSFGFADNWKDRPQRKCKGLYRVESEEGQKLCQQWTMSNESDEPPAEQEQSLWD